MKYETRNTYNYTYCRIIEIFNSIDLFVKIQNVEDDEDEIEVEVERLRLQPTRTEDACRILKLMHATDSFSEVKTETNLKSVCIKNERKQKKQKKLKT